MLAVRGGDQKAFAGLVYRFRDRLRRFYGSLGEEPESAEELAQEALVKLWVARERYEPSGRFTTYLFQIARNCWLNALRTRKRHPGGEAAEVEQIELGVSPAWPWNPVFNAYRTSEIRCAEAAGMLEVPTGTVKSRMSAAVHRLRDVLKDWSELE